MARTIVIVVAAISGLAILVVGGMTVLSAYHRVEQPIAFSHRLHIEDVGLDCTDCHLYARTGVRATIPNRDVCSGCHEEPNQESEGITRLLSYIESETDIPWQKVYWVPDHVYFSHRRHTAIGQLECEACHGPVQEREQPIDTQAIGITMARCMECHKESGASNDCIDCHR